VKCSNERGDSLYSDVLPVNTPTIPAPTNFEADPVSFNKVELHWTYPDDAVII